jgi:hypothetical protein
MGEILRLRSIPTTLQIDLRKVEGNGLALFRGGPAVRPPQLVDELGKFLDNHLSDRSETKELAKALFDFLTSQRALKQAEHLDIHLDNSVSKPDRGQDRYFKCVVGNEAAAERASIKERLSPPGGAAYRRQYGSSAATANSSKPTDLDAWNDFIDLKDVQPYKVKLSGLSDFSAEKRVLLAGPIPTIQGEFRTLIGWDPKNLKIFTFHKEGGPPVVSEVTSRFRNIEEVISCGFVPYLSQQVIKSQGNKDLVILLETD